jgi:bifunctional aspartokinase / homoserine dehydrogenase 2
MSQLNVAELVAENEQGENLVSVNKLVKHAVNIHKFGGSSLSTTACIERVVNIIRQNCQLNDVVVVSASGKTTDSLFALIDLATQQAKFAPALAELHLEQQALINSLLSANKAQLLLHHLTQDIKQLTRLLNELSQQKLPHQNDILAFGELWSARLLSAVLNSYVCPSYMLDARDFLQINNDIDCVVDEKTSGAQYRLQQQANKLVVVTGYIAKDVTGKTCTLGRNGSDYSATIIAALNQASNVTLWTDVDGIYSADPRIVPNSRKLHRLPNEVAQELGRLGNPVLHAKTLTPLATHKTHLHVASSFVPQTVGTEIGEFGAIAKQELSVTYLNDLLLVNSTSLQGEQGQQAQILFSAICGDNVQGLMVIEQAQQTALSYWLASFANEAIFTPVAIIATVGYQVANRGDVKARFKRALTSSLPLHFIATANSTDESHSIIAILPSNCTSELINNVHHDVTKEAKQIGLVVAGLGNIGQRFLELLPQQLMRINALENLHLVGLLSSTKALINNDGIDAQQAQQLFAEHAYDYDHQQLLSWLSNHPYDELIVVDITPSEAFSELYLKFFAQGIHVIGANKWAASANNHDYNLLTITANKQQSIWLGNTTVGAGLPINFAINDLRNSGDNINEIAGIFSGTLSWLFESYDGSLAFGELINKALAQGITEPDPRDDLSGRDVQRKLLILARAAGFTLELDDIDCQNLVPEHLQKLSKSEFLARTNELDQYFIEQLEQARTQQAVIRYVARFSAQGSGIKAQVSLETLKKDHAFANLTPGDNIFQVKTQWYNDNPLIIQGPGAGRDVTAGGLHSDLVNICQQLASKKTPVKIKGINE